jgi:hypothetical protein
MKQCLSIFLIFITFSATAQRIKILSKGTIVDITAGDTTRIGDSSWHYIQGAWNYQFDVLASTPEYPTGIWKPVGRVYINTCKCNPKAYKLEGFK